MIWRTDLGKYVRADQRASFIRSPGVWADEIPASVVPIHVHVLPELTIGAGCQN